MSTDWMQVINLLLNCLIIPLLWILLGIKTEIAGIAQTIAGHAERLSRIERQQDSE